MTGDQAAVQHMLDIWDEYKDYWMAIAAGEHLGMTPEEAEAIAKAYGIKEEGE